MSFAKAFSMRDTIFARFCACGIIGGICVVGVCLESGGGRDFVSPSFHLSSSGAFPGLCTGSTAVEVKPRQWCQIYVISCITLAIAPVIPSWATPTTTQHLFFFHAELVHLYFRTSCPRKLMGYVMLLPHEERAPPV